LTQQASRLLSDSRSEFEPDSKGEQIPLLGTVAAGLPIEAIEERRSLSLRTLFGDSDDIFALEVDGESMIEEGIQSGDYVICKRARRAENGQMVVAIVDNENATLKRFYREGNCAKLQAANPEYEPILTDKCRIEAVVLGHLRRT
jgi:repressor LexA